MARRVREGSFCVLLTGAALLCGCPPGPGVPGVPTHVVEVEPAAPIASGVYVAVYGRSDGVTMFRADPSPVGTWVSVDPGVTYPRLITTDPRAPASVYVVGAVTSGSSTERVRRSDDAGATWTTLIDLPTYVDRLTVDPGVPDRLWLTQQGGVGDPLVRRSDDGGQTWVVDDAGLPRGHQVRSLTFDAAATGVRYLGLSDGQAYRAVAPSGSHTAIPAPHGNLVADPGVADRLYAWAGGGELARSDDRGDTWSSLPGALPVIGQGSDWLLLDVAIDPLDPARIYLGTCPGGVWVSDDGGQSFQPRGPSGSAETVYRLHIDPTDPSQLLAEASGGVYLSDDRAVSWRLLDLSTATQEPFSGSAAAAGGPGKSTP